MYKKLLIVVVIAIVVLAIPLAIFIVYGNPFAGEGRVSPNYIEVEDFVGRTVKVPRDIEKVVAIGPGALRLVTYLNALNLIVGVEELEIGRTIVGRDYAMAYEDFLRNLPVVGPGGPRSPPDPERIRAVKPDLVIMSRTYVELYDPDRLSNEVGAPVIVVDYGVAGYLDLEYLKKALKLLGMVLGRVGRAEELCKFIDSVVEDLRVRTRDISKTPKVYVGAVSYKGKQPFTSSQVGFPPLLLVNTRSIVDEVKSEPGFISIDFEYLLTKQPEVVFIDLNNLDVVLNDFSKDPAKYCALKAFKEGRVYSILPFNYYHTNIATALADAYYIGKVLYPDKFIDVDPIAKANEIFRMFLGKDLYEKFVEGLGKGFGFLNDLFVCR